MAYPVWGRWKGGSQPFTSAIGDMRADRRSTNQKTSHSRSVFADLRSQPITMAAPVPMSVEAMQQLQQETAQRRQSLQQATTPASVCHVPNVVRRTRALISCLCQVESTPRYDVLSVDKLRELVRNVDPNERLDPEVENVHLATCSRRFDGDDDNLRTGTPTDSRRVRGQRGHVFLCNCKASEVVYARCERRPVVPRYVVHFGLPRQGIARI